MKKILIFIKNHIVISVLIITIIVGITIIILLVNANNKEIQILEEKNRKRAETQFAKDFEDKKVEQQEIEKVYSKIESSYSKDYNLGWLTTSDEWSTMESWRYNYYTKLYSGSTQNNYEVVTKELKASEVIEGGVKTTGITVENFKNKVYPILKQKINQNLSKEEREKALVKLDELYHLSD